MMTTATVPVLGIFSPVSPVIATHTQDATLASAAQIDRLVQLYHSNADLFQELKSLLTKLDSLSAYLDTPGHNPVLGHFQMLRLKARHAAILAVLAENRVETHRLLARDLDIPGSTP
jgi:hypothetical protein